MRVRFWGVRGSVAVSGAPFLHTGGNTTCVELEHEGQRLVLDGGTGLQALGREIGSPADLTVLFTHVHWDHIQGVPYFGPLFHPGSHVTMCGQRSVWGSLRRALDAQMQPPSFPVTMDAFQARMDFVDVDPEHTFEIGPFRIRSAELTHPNGVLVYRIEAGGRAVVFATDVEHGDRLDPRLLRLADGADLLIHDAQYTEDEYHGRGTFPRVGWGHSTWNQAVEAGASAGVGQVALFHHDPARTDDAVAVIEAAARAEPTRPHGVFAAREGEVVAL